MKNVFSICQKQFQERYPNMKPKAWMHLVRAYIEKITGKQGIDDNDIVHLKHA